jgi:hypothetical protein
MAAPSTPSNLIVQQANGQVYLNWDLSAGATLYLVYRSTDNVNFTLISTAAPNDYSDTGVTLNTLYWYKVSASNGAESAKTDSQSIIPTLNGIESLASLRLQAQQRADRVNSNFVTTAEWNTYINQSARELHDLLITEYEDYSLAEPYTFITNGSLNQYDLPDSTKTDVNGIKAKQFYKLMGVDLGLANNNNAKVTVHKYDFIERNRYVYPNITSTFLGVFNMRYRVMGNKIHFIPTPSAGQYVTLWYIPRLETMLKDTDTMDTISGWSEYVIVDAAIKALQKEESDVSVLMAEKAAVKARIESAADNRDAGQPDTISNTRAFNSRGGNGSWGFDGSSGGF